MQVRIKKRRRMSVNSIEEIKDRKILEIVACTNKDEEAVMLVTIGNE